MKSSVLSIDYLGIDYLLKSKLHFRGMECRSEKPQAHRYERRKARQVLREWDMLGD